MNILMFPWLAHGHISPFLELAKKLTTRSNIRVYFYSTRVNLDPIKNRKQSVDHDDGIELVELHLPSSPELPPQYHTTNGLPPHLVDTLKQAFHESAPSSFSRLLEALKPKPDLVIYDFIQSWAPPLASSHGIPAVELSIIGASCNSYLLKMDDHDAVAGEGFPFPEIWMSDFEKSNSRIPRGVSTRERSKEAMRLSTKIVLIRTFREIEAKYLDYLSSELGDKRIVPVGPLVKDTDQDEHDGDEYEYISTWLDEKEASSTVFVSFGSEYFLTNEELEEVANGLELSSVNFVWVIRLVEKPDHPYEVESMLPVGFVERVVGKRGLVVEGWAPQARILAHPSVGGFVSHCGWSSVLESMVLGVPIIAMPMQIDQPINARLVASLGVGLEVRRDECGKLRRDEIARVIKKVVMEEGGKDLKAKARDLSEVMLKNGEKEVDDMVNELVQICKEYGKV